MEKFLDEMRRIEWLCDELFRLIHNEDIQRNIQTMKCNLEKIDRSFCGSWIGYHSCVYYDGFQPPQAGDHFDIEWGFLYNYTSSNWREVNEQDVERFVMKGVDEDFRKRLNEIYKQAKEGLDDLKDSLATVLGIFLEKSHSNDLEKYNNDINDVTSYLRDVDIINRLKPRSIISRDSKAIYQGLRIPPHVQLQAWLLSRENIFYTLQNLGKFVHKVIRHIELRKEVSMVYSDKKELKIFIGHGKSHLWRELKDFVADRLKLPWNEFNRESPAGLTTIERLREMMDNSNFAFLIMTAEDEHANSSLHARENVIHEAGLFQGRLGFRKSILLLEQGCSEFSNIVGLNQIRFPKGHIAAIFEEVRRVLEREGII